MSEVVSPLRLSDFQKSDGTPVNPPVFVPFQKPLCERMNYSMSGGIGSYSSSFEREMVSEGWEATATDLNALKLGYNNPSLTSQQSLKITYPGSKTQKINVTQETVNRTSSGWIYTTNPRMVPQSDPLMAPQSVIPTDRGFVTAVNINSAVPMIMLEVLQDCQGSIQLMLEKRVT